MKFEWDQDKNHLNIRKHGFDFADAPEVFRNPMLVTLDERKDYGEDRWTGMGILRTEFVVVIYTEREDVIRLISLRKATRHEREGFIQFLQDRLGQNP